MSAAAFITRWQSATGSELANAQLFVTELCELLSLPRPNPATGIADQDSYVFERRAQHTHGDGAESERRIDCYKRGSFILEAKKIRFGTHTKGFDDARLRARAQAEQYARDIPAAEGRPPFLVVVDVGRFIELYAEFTQTGATYTPYPDPRSHRIVLSDLERPEIQARLKALWLDAPSLNPARQSAKVTREVADALAKIAKSLEAAQHPPQQVAEFLTRCLFTFFAEDVKLLPERSFTDLLESLIKAPQQFVPLVTELWTSMDKGAFSIAIRKDVLRFNGKLFKNPEVLPLNAEQITLLHDAARKNWSTVEPAIIGTLLERALNPRERHALGAHYTPRAYVERLVLPTVIDPLREDWANAQAAALTQASEGNRKAALAELTRFHHALCNVRVLDPACGSGNFLYVTLEHLKRLEGEVLNQMAELSDGQQKLETEGLTVDPHQFLGLELNPRAAALAELVLWIGYLQWHFRTRGDATPPLPVLKDFRTIECRDAVLSHDGMRYAMDEHGKPITRWDGRTFKAHPVTGEPVPDEAAQTALETFANPRPAEWPQADFVVGNPPFIGAKHLRDALGDGYAEALRNAWPQVPESADFVMYWWQRAADLTRMGALRRFGLITTNSIRQTFNRRVLADAMTASASAERGARSAERGARSAEREKIPLHLGFAIPDHPWTDASDGAAVRIAMTVGSAAPGEGLLLTVTAEHDTEESEGIAVSFASKTGVIHSDLSIGANVAAAVALRANEDIGSRGVQLIGAGFIVTPEEAARLLPPVVPAQAGTQSHGGAQTAMLDSRLRGNDSKSVIHHYRNGRDLTDTPRGVQVIDAFGLTAEQLREAHPAIYQWLLERVKPERDANARATYRDNWWIHGEPRRELRKHLHGLPRYIATVATSKHRFFIFLGCDIRPDDAVIAIALNDAAALTILSSWPHQYWSAATGSRLGVGNDSRYIHSRCFETFPSQPSPPHNATR